MKKLVLFDFCGTLVNFQTFDPYIKKVVLAYYPKRGRWLDSRMARFLSGILSRFKRDYHFYKHYLVWLTRGIPEMAFREVAVQYCRDSLCPNVIPEAREMLLEFGRKGCEVVILSGGCGIYIRKFAEEYHVEKVIATEIVFKNGKSSGKIVRDCLGRGKIEMLNARLGRRCLERYDVTGVTDSRSDLPMLGICGKKIVISHGRHQDWVSEDMEEVIWHGKNETVK